MHYKVIAKKIGLIILGCLVILGVLMGYGLYLVNQEEKANKSQPEVAQEEKPKCNRESPLSIAPELLRSVDLIKRRYDDKHQDYMRWGRANKKDVLDFSFWSLYSSQIAEVRNCLNISYSDNLDVGLDGRFTYGNSATPEELRIEIASRYRQEDELVISTLLSHEIYHAIAFNRDYRDLPPGKTRQQNADECLTEEGRAFTKQVEFYSFLTPKEQDFLSKELRGKGSDQVALLFQLVKIAKTDPNWMGIPAQNNKAIEDAVRSDPDYIKECSQS